MKNEKILLTEEGLRDLEQELETRTSETRTKIADDIEYARQQGDLSENAAYKAAMEAKEFNENRIQKLEEMISNAEVTKRVSKKEGVGIGVKVEIENQSNGSTQTFNIVGQSEADPVEKKISLDSPIGSALAGKKEGDIVKVDLPSGEIDFKIIKIS